MTCKKTILNKEILLLLLLGPSGIDAYSWRRIIVSRYFGKVTDDIFQVYSSYG